MSKTSKASKQWKKAYENANGPVKISMTNDYLFKAFLQENKKALAGLISALLHLPPGRIRQTRVENPIILGQKVDAKTVILDVNVTYNNGVRVNLELQVVNEDNWPERSVYYACRNYAELNKGELYKTVKPVYQIGIVDFTPFPDNPSFYTTYQLRDAKRHRLYTDKFNIGVVDLTEISLATKEDKAYNIDKWAELFKAQTWEEIKMIAKKDEAISEAAYTIYKISEDERIRQECEAREMYLLKERARKKQDRDYKKAQKKLALLEEQLSQKDEQIANLQSKIAELEKQK